MWSRCEKTVGAPIVSQATGDTSQYAMTTTFTRGGLEPGTIDPARAGASVPRPWSSWTTTNVTVKWLI